MPPSLFIIRGHHRRSVLEGRPLQGPQGPPPLLEPDVVPAREVLARRLLRQGPEPSRRGRRRRRRVSPVAAAPAPRRGRARRVPVGDVRRDRPAADPPHDAVAEGRAGRPGPRRLLGIVPVHVPRLVSHHAGVALGLVVGEIVRRPRAGPVVAGVGPRGRGRRRRRERRQAPPLRRDRRRLGDGRGGHVAVRVPGRAGQAPGMPRRRRGSSGVR
mmetsp:Transcript_3675/g.7450  ORF Transcript_3675/g.7450 Transcript_3675/m.7450 type:complete len:214 (-) Transcript_3675:399-1040(-)